MRKYSTVLTEAQGETYISKGSESLVAGITQYVFVGLMKHIQEFYPNGKKNPMFGTFEMNGYKHPLGVCYSPETWQPYHLHVIDKEADFHVGEVVYSIRGFVGKFENSYTNECFKVVATTDKSLGLPQLSVKFLEGYIEYPEDSIDFVDHEFVRIPQMTLEELNDFYQDEEFDDYPDDSI